MENSSPEATTAPIVQLTVNQLQLMVSIIEAGTQRGTWKPEELMAVGQLYNVLKNGLTQATKPAAGAESGGKQ